MKAFITFVLAAAFAAGLVVGYVEHGIERRDSEETSGGEPERRPPIAADRGVPGKARPDARVASVDSGAEEPDASPDSPEPADPAEGDGPSAEIDRKLAEVRDLLAKRDYGAAETLASATVQAWAETGVGSRAQIEEAARLRARARIVGRLFESLPEAQPIQGLSELVLANGTTLRATQVDREGDRYLVKLVTGVTWKAGPEDIVDVRSLDAAGYVASEREKIEQRLRGLKHPVDLYLDGVGRYHALGLDSEAVKILDRILAAPTEDSLEVLLLFVPEVDDVLRADWRVATGGAAPSLPEPRVQVASAPPAESPPAAPPRAESPPPESLPGPPSAAADTNELFRAVQLITEADLLYRGAVREEGKEGDLAKARDILDRAREIIDRQPSDETVQKLRRQIGQLMSDVARASPF